MSILSIQNFLVEGGMVALAGLGYVTYKKFHIPQSYPELDHTCFLKYSPFAESIMHLKAIDSNDLWIKITHDVDYLISLSQKPSASNAWLANRVITSIRSTTETIMEHAKTSRNNEILDRAIDIDTDTIPLLEKMYEELIHNMLMPSE